MPALEGRPSLEAGDDFYLGALSVLAGDRDAAGHVSFQSALLYGEAFGLTVDETLELHQVLAIAHACLIEWRKAKPVG